MNRPSYWNELTGEREEYTNYQPFTDEANGEDQIGEHLLDQIHAFLRRFIAYPSEEASIAHALWIAHTHMMEAFEATPRIAFLSPEKASGKTRALEVTANLVPNPVEFDQRHTGLSDPQDRQSRQNVRRCFTTRSTRYSDQRPKRTTRTFAPFSMPAIGKAQHPVDVRSSGHTVRTEEIPSYCAVALAGLGWLPDTLLSRCVIIRMRRRKPSETAGAISAQDGRAARPRPAQISSRLGLQK